MEVYKYIGKYCVNYGGCSILSIATRGMMNSPQIIRLYEDFINKFGFSDRENIAEEAGAALGQIVKILFDINKKQLPQEDIDDIIMDLLNNYKLIASAAIG